MTIEDIYDFAKKHGLEYVDFDPHVGGFISTAPAVSISWDKDDDVYLHKWVDIDIVDGKFVLVEIYTCTTSDGGLFDLDEDSLDELGLTEEEIEAIFEDLDSYI